VSITEKEVVTIKELLTVIPEIRQQFGVSRNPDVKEALLYCGVAESNIIPALTPLIEKYFGKAYKPAGSWAFFKNWFDPFVKAIGGIRTDQTLFKKDIRENLWVYCAFWPWGSNPVKTSIRIGIICETDEEEDYLDKQLKSSFSGAAPAQATTEAKS